MIRSSVRSAGLAILLTVNGCGSLTSSGSGARTPGLPVAEAALEGGAGQIALQVSEGVLRDAPDNMRAMAIKGDALALLGDYDEATAVFQAMLAKDPNSARANIGLGRIKLSKDPRAAEGLFQAVLRHDPKDLTALNNLGIAHDLQGRHAEAQTSYRQALAINPGLDSAQVNLALSLAMTGHGPEAIQLLRTKANEPGAPAKVRRDYAVVLAMSGNRPEAERVLSTDLAPDEARQVLDNATGVHTRLVRDPSQQRMLAQARPDDVVPPDVVQVPEGSQAPMTRVALVPVRPSPAITPTVAALAAAPAPMVVRPQQAGPDAEPSNVQPVNAIAAAMTNQRPLAAPVRSTDLPPPAPARPHAQEMTAEPALVVPEVVTMPAARPARAAQPAPVRVAAVEPPGYPPHTAMPEAPPSPPVLAPVPLPPAWRPLPAAARAGAPALTEPNPTNAAVAAAPVHSVAEPAMSAEPNAPPSTADAWTDDATAVSVRAASAAVAPPRMRSTDATEIDTPVAVAMASAVTQTASRDMARDEIGPSVQFAATGSEEAAHAFWQTLVQRYPDVLGQRAPAVIRYERGATVFWRVRTEGFGTLAEAQTLCARMRASGQPCFVPRS